MSSEPPDYSGEDYSPRGPGEPYGRLDGPSEAVRGRVQPPAICLIVVAGLNVLWAIYLVINSVFVTVTPAEEQMRQQAKVFRALGIDPGQLGKTPEETRKTALLINWPLTVLALAGTVLTLLGGIGMFRFRWYGLAVTGSIIAAIPCISCLGCCGVGEGIGIWSLVVLLNEEVKAAFQ
jgi:hypothetical protein